MYEDLTNILITGAKSERDPELPSISVNYQCVYTHRSDTTARSIRFQLRVWREHDESGLVEHVRYTPLDLDKESVQFKDNLSFIGDTFAFKRGQIHVFFEQLKEHMGMAVDAETEVIEVLSDG